MKRLTLVSLLALSTIASYGQGFSAGVKTGVTNWLSIYHGGSNFIQPAEDGKVSTWHKEVFARYELKKNLAFEIGLDNTKRELTPYSAQVTCIYPFDKTYTKETREITQLNITAQYKISIRCLEKCPYLARFSNYIGIMVSPSLVRSELLTESSSSYDKTVAYYTTPGTNNWYGLSYGISNTLKYKVTKHFSVLGTISAQVIDNSRYSYYSEFANVRTTMALGAAYSLK